MAQREVHPPGGRYKGKNKVYAGGGSSERQWRKLCQSRPGPMRRCYRELADRPFPPPPLPRHHELRGSRKGHWEYEVGGGERVRYKRGPRGRVVITYAGSHPADTG